MHDDGFEIKLVTNGDEITVHLAGELDLAVRPVVVERVTAEAGPGVARIVVDLGAVSFCDSSGLGALLDLKRHADGIGADLVLRSVPEPVTRLLELADVDGWLARE